MNFVQLSGYLTSKPRIASSQKGKTASFTLRTEIPYINKNGETEYTKSLHRIFLWGSWVNLIEELAEPGQKVFIQGSLNTAYRTDAAGKKLSYTQVVVNDLTLA